MNGVEAKVQISDLRHLEDNWDSYGSAAPAEEAIDSALNYIGLLMQGRGKVIHIGPNVSGGVGITIMDGKTEIVIMFLNEYLEEE